MPTASKGVAAANEQRRNMIWKAHKMGNKPTKIGLMFKMDKSNVRRIIRKEEKRRALMAEGLKT